MRSSRVTPAPGAGPNHRKVKMDSLRTEFPIWKTTKLPGLRRAAGLLLLAALAVPPCVMAQVAAPPSGVALMAQDQIEDLRSRARQAGVGEESLGPWIERIHRLEQEGLPWEPVADRIRQGLAKGADAARIEMACSRLESRLRDGGRLIDGVFDGHDRLPGSAAAGARLALIDQTAFALDKGIPPESIGQLFTRVEMPGTAVERMNGARAPLLAFTSLASAGIAPDRGLQFVSEVHQGGIRGAALEELGLAVAQSLRAGDTLDAIQQRIRDGLRRGVAPGQIVNGLRGARKGPPGGTAGPPGGPRTGPGGLRPPQDDPGRPGRPGGGTGRGGGPRG